MPKKKKTITIVGQNWSVNYTLALPSHLLGECDHETLEINVRADIAPGLRKETFLHELLHAIFGTIGISNMLARYNPHLEEQIIERLSPILYATLKENKVRF